MRPNPQFSADLVAFTEETFNGKLYLLRSQNKKLNWAKQKSQAENIYKTMIDYVTDLFGRDICSLLEVFKVFSKQSGHFLLLH